MEEVLIAHHDADHLINIQETLQQGNDCRCETVRNVADFNRKNPARFDVFVIDVALPPDKSSMTLQGNTEMHGLRLAEKLRADGHPAPILLVADALDDDITGTAGRLGQCRIATTGADGNRELADCYKDLTRAPGETKRNALNVEIVLELSQEPPVCLCYLRHQHTQKPLDKLFRFNLVRNDLEELVKRVTSLHDTEWEDSLRSIGRSIHGHFFANRPDLLTAFQAHGGLQSARIHFNVSATDRDRPIHQIPFEAIYDDQNASYWMLTAPIYRRYNNRVTPRVPLFKDPASRQNYVNCLIIESDVEGKIPYPIDAMFSRLEGVAREAQALEDYFTEQRRRFRLGEVKRYPRDFEKAPEKYVEGLEKALSGQRWNMVHYIGHSKRAVTGRVDERTMMNVTEAAGYLVLPPREPYPMNRFVDFLKQANTQFLFLSSCEAANYEFLWEASREVPAVLGYRWPVADGDAREFATVFYQKLFEGTRFLEYAFANARREMYDRIKRKTAYRSEQPSVWASPVLLMQIGDNYGQAHAPHGAATWQ